MVKRIILLITGMLIFNAVSLYAAAPGPAPRIKVSVDRRTIYIGDPVKFTVTVQSDKNTEIAFPIFKDETMGGFEIKDRRIKQKKSIFGNFLFTGRYTITSYVTGDRPIPPFPIRYRKRGAGDWNVITSAEVAITVKSILPQGGALPDIRDIKGPRSFREPNMPLIAVIVFFLAAALIIYRFYRSRMMRKSLKLPHETALEELEAIRGILGRGGDIKDCYAMVSDCIRYYIERRFSFKAPEMTTEEFLESLKNSHALSVDHKRLLREFMTACDLVKFAKYIPRHEEVEGIFVAAKNFIEETKAIPDGGGSK